MVELFYRGERVASHVRSYEKGGHTTREEHMPDGHRFHKSQTPAKILKRAEKIGPSVAELCRQIMSAKPHPELGARACLGIIRLAKEYGHDRAEAASARALLAGTHRYESIRSILARGLDKLPLVVAEETKPLPNHKHIRGPAYFN